VHSLALSWDGRVYSWGHNGDGQLGHGDKADRPLPALVEGLEGVRGVAVAVSHSLAVTQSGDFFSWGTSFLTEREGTLRPTTVEGFGGVRVRRVCAAYLTACAIGEAGELFSWGSGKNMYLGPGPGDTVKNKRPGHGDTEDQPAPKRVEALRGVRVSSVALGGWHAVALAEDGLVYTWGENMERAALGNPNVESELLPKTVEALRGVRVGSIAAADKRSYAVSDMGEVWAWGFDADGAPPLGHGEAFECPLPKPIDMFPRRYGTKVHAVAAGDDHTLALAENGSVYAWGHDYGAHSGALGVGAVKGRATRRMRTPHRVPGLRLRILC
jgi:hypothetical protein